MLFYRKSYDFHLLDINYNMTPFVLYNSSPSKKERMLEKRKHNNIYHYIYILDFVPSIFNTYISKGHKF